MSLTTNMIKKRLTSVANNLKDNEAQNIINRASTSDIKSLNVESILRLYEALAMLPPRVFSNLDAAAMKRLRMHTQYQPVLFTPAYGVGLIKNACRGQAIVRSQLTPDIINRLYAAEKKRLSWYEAIGIDGKSIGRGQLTQLAYTDVKSPKHFQGALNTCLTQVFISNLLKNAPFSFTSQFNWQTYALNIPLNYSDIYRTPALEDLVVAGYVAVKIKAATKSGRSAIDTARFAIAVYHGMRPSLVNAQSTVNDTINWAPVAAELIKQGQSDQVAYVNEVIK